MCKRSGILVIPFIMAMMIFGCASVTDVVPDEEVVLVSGNVYEILDVDHRGIFGSEDSLKDYVFKQADSFAKNQGKVAIPVAARIHRVGILGDWAWFYYKFELVDEGTPESFRNITDIQIVRDARLAPEFYLDRHKGDQAEKSVYGEITQLDELRKKGLLTDVEFDEQKKRILERAGE